ncbi:hypothetical protein JXA34_02560 [Patescibacteria group bacterium]|nr:hypothetical protein [Patescibacteria group bacterium]
MKLKSKRAFAELAEVLKNPEEGGPEIAYWVFEDISSSKWKNLTLITPGRYGDEYPKTYGHYHTSEQMFESSKLISGEGIFLLQKKFYDRNGNWIQNRVESVYFIQAMPGDEMVYIPREFAHSWSNVGNLPLITYDDWIETGQPTHTYAEIRNLKGMAYYLVENPNGQIDYVSNLNYIDNPEPKWVTPEEFNYLTQNKYHEKKQ